MKLTVVVPLKGRPRFTLRLLRYAHERRLPYHFLLADGEVRPGLADKLEFADMLWPGLSVEYRRYPDDVNLACYFAKMADVMGRVQTPYVMLADNDDFLCRDGIDRAVDFLERNVDWVCAGGQTLGFSVAGALPGDYGRLRRRYCYYRGGDLGYDSAADRIRAGALKLWVYYAVHRTETMRQVHREIAELNFPDLLMYEFYHVARTLSLGKAHFDDTAVTYMRQYGTSTSAATPYRELHEWSPSFNAFVPDKFGHNEFLAAVDALVEKVMQYNAAKGSHLAAVSRAWPNLAAHWRSRPRPFEWNRSRRLLGPRAAAQAEREFAIIARFLNPSPGRIAAVKHDQLMQEIAQ